MIKYQVILSEICGETRIDREIVLAEKNTPEEAETYIEDICKNYYESERLYVRKVYTGTEKNTTTNWLLRKLR